MPTTTTTFRLDESDKGKLDRLASRLLVSRTDVLRLGLARLLSDPDYLREVEAENRARIFLKNLMTQYGADAVLELSDPTDASTYRLAGEPIDADVLDVNIRDVGDHFVLDLIDQRQGVQILNAIVHDRWETEDGKRHAVARLDRLWVHTNSPAIADPKTRQLYDGRVVVQIEEDDGTVKHFVMDGTGQSRHLDDGDVPRAAFRA